MAEIIRFPATGRACDCTDENEFVSQARANLARLSAQIDFVRGFLSVVDDVLARSSDIPDRQALLAENERLKRELEKTTEIIRRTERRLNGVTAGQATRVS